MLNMSCHKNGIDNQLPWLCVMCSDIAPDPLEPSVFGSSCTYIFVCLFTCKYYIVYICTVHWMQLYYCLTSCIYLFIYFFYFDHWGVWLLQASLFSIYSLTSTGIKGILLRCSSCILTLRICFMSAVGVDDYNLYMQAGDS